MMKRIAPGGGLGLARAMLAMVVGCGGAVDRTADPPEPSQAVARDASTPPPPADAGTMGWASDDVCNAGAKTLAECCDLGVGSCATVAENARCCGDKSCADGKLVACLAAFVPSESDRCLGALSACNKM